MTCTDTFDPLQALSLAVTALTDPGGLPVDVEPASLVDYAADRVNEAIGALHFEGSNDYAAEARWVITHLGRLLAAVADTLEAEADDFQDTGALHAARLIHEGLGSVDRAVDALRDAS